MFSTPNGHQTNVAYGMVSSPPPPSSANELQVNLAYGVLPATSRRQRQT